MIKLLNLKIENFGVFKDVKLDFEDKQVVGILAEYENDKKRSNMAGKSIISESIRYNLVGITRYKKELKMIHYGESMMKVTCQYLDEDTGKKYKITRGRDSKNNGLLELDWIEKSRESQQAISDIFGVSKEDFDITSFFKQADINGFMDLSPADKTAYLQKAMNNNHWKEKEEMVKEDIKAFNIKLKENQAVLNSLESSMEVDEHLKAEVKELEKSSSSLKKTVSGAKERLKTISGTIKKVEENNWKKCESIKSLQKQMLIIKTNADKSKKLKNKIVSNKKLLSELESSTRDIKPTIEEVLEKRINLKNSYDEKSEILNSPNNSGVCPIINESCDRISLSDKECSRIEKKIKLISSDLNDCSGLIKEIRANDKLLSEIKGLKSDIKASILRFKDLKESSNPSVIEAQIVDLEKSKEPIDDDMVSEINSLETKIDTLDSELSSNKNKVTVLNHRISEAEKSLEKINEIYDKNEKLVNKLEQLKYISMMFGKSGILADEIENAFTEIQDDINYILKELDCGLTVSFSPDKELNKKESVCSCGFVYYKNYKKPVCEECGAERRKARKDEISLQILDSNGNEADFDGGSGGQKSIISYAVRIALTMFKRRQNQCQLNILFLDEVDSALDSHLATAITDSITKVLTRKLGYSQILMISHKEEIKNSVPSIIKVVKHSDYSTAKFV